jgi:hypothetical protein
MGDVDSKIEEGGRAPAKIAHSPVEDGEEELFEECNNSDEDYLAKGLSCFYPLGASAATNRVPGEGWGPRIGPSQLPRRMMGQDDALGDTVIIFDWDDTLLCTSAINAEEWTLVQLWQLERAVEAVLRVAMLLGETFIITNGIESWVEHSAARYIPGILPLLRSLKVTSARAKYEPDHPGNPFIWKELAFKDLLMQRQAKAAGRAASWPVAKTQAGDSTGDAGQVAVLGVASELEADGADEGHLLNLVVLGDGDAEILAAQCLGRLLRPSSKIKTVKFKAQPSVAELLGQLRRVVQELGQIVEAKRSLSQGLVLKVLPNQLGHLANWASGWTCTDDQGLFRRVRGDDRESDTDAGCNLDVTRGCLSTLWPVLS